ncbi:MAG: nucleotide exchange factor GrpE [Thermodesulfobacteriota bacterium]
MVKEEDEDGKGADPSSAAQTIEPQSESGQSPEVDDSLSDEGSGCQDELTKAQEELSASQDKLLRLAADFENYKKRMERSRLEGMKYREEAILKELLPVIDNLGRAIEQGQNSGGAGELLEGVELTHKGLLKVLDNFEVKPLVSVGQKFDPNLHEALAMDASDDVAENHVLLEFEKAYQYKDRLLRPAKVVVSKGPA